ncbi:energy transducer TonB [Qipengyuania xiapuensis]|uniref:Energy transducer TonB n=1 Tax=Qipengyuania xiapuensis TaxID=2867236 RepID=A0ABX8ZWG9_9SPHN|nr:energy transducer TonB [Qipengyuania xiapuensis]QZD93340.1 energy transducer TonB [Qipengyuania xiapuensis]
MSYVDQKRGPSATGLAGAIIVQASIGAAIIAGLSVAQIVQEEDDIFVGIELKDPPPPAPPPPPTDQPKPNTDTPPVSVPDNKFRLDPVEPTIPTTTEMFPEGPIILDPGPTRIVEPVIPGPTATFSPVGAKPRNDPGGWLRDRDYRSSWSRMELTGTASFRLQIAATGKVTGCEITGSTGHRQLDEATCNLLPRRAKFEPARGSNGEPVAGEFKGSVVWKLPE